MGALLTPRLLLLQLQPLHVLAVCQHPAVHTARPETSRRHRHRQVQILNIHRHNSRMHSCICRQSAVMLHLANVKEGSIPLHALPAIVSEQVPIEAEHLLSCLWRGQLALWPAMSALPGFCLVDQAVSLTCTPAKTFHQAGQGTVGFFASTCMAAVSEPGPFSRPGVQS